MQNKSTIPAVSNLSFGEPKNVKQILWKKLEYYDFNVVDDSKTRRIVGCKRNEHQRRPEFDKGAKQQALENKEFRRQVEVEAPRQRYRQV